MPMYLYRCEVLAVLDGDTAKLRIDLGLRTYRDETIRLYGLDAPELDEPGGPEAYAFLFGCLTKAHHLEVETHKTRKGDEKQEKYGRWLGLFWADGMNVNKAMLDKGLAKPW